MLTYNSGADGHYISEKDSKELGLPIFCVYSKKVGVANGGTWNGKYVTKLPFYRLSNKAAEAETFEELPTSLIIVRKTADVGNVSIITREDVTVYKEENVLITFQRNPILVGKRDECGRYRIQLT